MVIPLTFTPLIHIPIIQPGDNLAFFISSSLEEQEIILQDNDILVITQKIVSKSEDRFVNLQTVRPGTEALELAGQTHKDPRLVDLILQESRQVLRFRNDLIIVEHRLGFICANAGIDHSNVCLESDNLEQGEWVLLLPKDPDKSARNIKTDLERQFGVQVGVIIIDTQGRAWRIGVTGMAIGLSGLPGTVDLRGYVDLFNRPLRITIEASADELAGAASLLMGQAAEGRPVVHIRGYPYPLGKGSLSDLIRPSHVDLFR